MKQFGSTHNSLPLSFRHERYLVTLDLLSLMVHACQPFEIIQKIERDC